VKIQTPDWELDELPPSLPLAMMSRPMVPPMATAATAKRRRKRCVVRLRAETRNSRVTMGKSIRAGG
jgi:hypothetical protein